MVEDGANAVPLWELNLGHDAALSSHENVVRDLAVVVTFRPPVVEALWAQAAQRHDEMKGKRLTYGRASTQRGQFRGLIGEAGTIAWLDTVLPGSHPDTYLLYGPTPSGSDAYADLKDGQGLTSIDAKTSGQEFWHQNGRLVNAAQLARMSSDLLMWCVAPEESDDEVILVGWSPVEEARATGEPRLIDGTERVRVRARLRPPMLLARWLVSGRRTPLPT